MRKIKKAMVLSLALAMGLSLVACGDKKEDDKKGDDGTTTEKKEDGGNASNGDSSEGDDATVDFGTGKVYNINVWNEEFKSRVEEFYPGYEKVDATSGKIGDIDVKWSIVPSDENGYQNDLDADLQAQADASADEKVDMFLVEADYALKYVDTEYTMSMKDIGITDADLSKQYQYTKDVMTDSNGVLKGVSWQGCPGVLFYNRELAKEVLGTDDPAEVQKSVETWDKFMETAQAMADKGYLMSSATNDTYRVFSNNATSKWVDADKNVNIDANVKKWVDTAKQLVDMKATAVADLWSEEWSKGFYPEGKVFCYFGPMWEVNFSMATEDEKSIAYNGGWGACPGPQGFYWGGTWICAAAGSDNTGLTADIIRKLCCDNTIMKNIATKCDEFVNNKEVIAEISSDTNLGAKTLGGQNPYAMLAEGAEKIDLSNCSAYDQGCNEEFQKAMTDYFNGKVDYDAAVDTFMKNIKVKYPVLDK